MPSPESPGQQPAPDATEQNPPENRGFISLETLALIVLLLIILIGTIMLIGPQTQSIYQNVGMDL